MQSSHYPLTPTSPSRSSPKRSIDFDFQKSSSMATPPPGGAPNLPLADQHGQGHPQAHRNPYAGNMPPGLQNNSANLRINPVNTNVHAPAHQMPPSPRSQVPSSPSQYAPQRQHHQPPPSPCSYGPHGGQGVHGGFPQQHPQHNTSGHYRHNHGNKSAPFSSHSGGNHPPTSTIHILNPAFPSVELKAYLATIRGFRKIIFHPLGILASFSSVDHATAAMGVLMEAHRMRCHYTSFEPINPLPSTNPPSSTIRVKIFPSNFDTRELERIFQAYPGFRGITFQNGNCMVDYVSIDAARATLEDLHSTTNLIANFSRLDGKRALNNSHQSHLASHGNPAYHHGGPGSAYGQNLSIVTGSPTAAYSPDAWAGYGPGSPVVGGYAGMLASPGPASMPARADCIVQVTQCVGDIAELKRYFSAFSGFEKVDFHPDKVCFVCFASPGHANAAVEGITAHSPMRAAVDNSYIPFCTKPSNNPPNTVLHVTVYPNSAVEEEVIKICRGYPGFEKAFFDKGNCLVHFGTMDQARVALEDLNNTTNLVTNFTRRVNFANVPPQPSGSAESRPMASPGGDASPTSPYGAFPLKEYPPNKTLQVRQPPHMDRSHLHQYAVGLKGFSKIAFYRDWAFFCFADISSATAALNSINSTTDMRAAFTKEDWVRRSTSDSASLGEPCPTLYVNNLPFNATELEFRRLFATLNGFQGSYFFKGSCKVYFDTIENATAATNLINDTTNLHASYYDRTGKGTRTSQEELGGPEEGPRTGDAADGGLSQASSSNDLVGLHGGLLSPGVRKRSENPVDLGRSVPRATLHVVSHNFDKADLKLFFSNFEGFRKVAFYRDWCFIIFESPELAQAALEKAQQEKGIRAAFAKDEFQQNYSIPFSGEPNSILYVSQLPWDATSKELKKLFSAYDGFENVFFIREACKVYFGSSEKAAQALAKLNLETNLVASFFRGEDDQPPLSGANRAPMTPSQGAPGASTDFASSLTALALGPKSGPGQFAPKATLHLSNVTRDRADLLDMFRQMPGFQKIAFNPNWVFVRFSDVESAAMALNKLHSTSRMQASFAQVDYVANSYPPPELGHVACQTLRVTNQPANATEEEMYRILKQYEGLVNVEFADADVFAHYGTPDQARAALLDLNDKTNFHVEFVAQQSSGLQNQPRLTARRGSISEPTSPTNRGLPLDGMGQYGGGGSLYMGSGSRAAHGTIEGLDLYATDSSSRRLDPSAAAFAHTATVPTGGAYSKRSFGLSPITVQNLDSATHRASAPQSAPIISLHQSYPGFNSSFGLPDMSLNARYGAPSTARVLGAKDLRGAAEEHDYNVSATSGDGSMGSGSRPYSPLARFPGGSSGKGPAALNLSPQDFAGETPDVWSSFLSPPSSPGLPLHSTHGSEVARSKLLPGDMLTPGSPIRSARPTLPLADETFSMPAPYKGAIQDPALKAYLDDLLVSMASLKSRADLWERRCDVLETSNEALRGKCLDLEKRLPK